MKAFLSKPAAGKMLLLTLDSENEAEANILQEVAKTIPTLNLLSGGNSLVDGVVRLQYGAETKDSDRWEIKSK